MKRYFYLAASLHDLSLEKKLPLTFSDFLEDAYIYLTEHDKKLVSIIRELIDIENIRRLILQQDIDTRGNLSEKALDEAILAKVNLPRYACDFLDEYTTAQSRLDNFPFLYALFYQSHTHTGNEFLDQYLAFERELRLWICLLRAKKMDADIRDTLQFEDPQDPLVMKILVQADASDVLIPQEFSKIKNIYNDISINPADLHKEIETFRLNKITELVQDKLFKIDSILGFMAKLLIIEQWQALNPEEGLNRLNRFIKKH